MTGTELFEETKDVMSGREDMLINQQFITRLNDAIAVVSGRTMPLKLITFDDNDDIARTTTYGFSIKRHPKITLENADITQIQLEPELIIALKNSIASLYEPMMAKQFMSMYWEMIGTYNNNVISSREFKDLLKGGVRVFP